MARPRTITFGGILRPAPPILNTGAMLERPRARFPALAAALSFLFPGLGQAYAREPILAVLLAAPVLLLVLGGILALAVGVGAFRNAVFSSQFLTALLLLDAALLAWRLFAILQVGAARPHTPGPAEGRVAPSGNPAPAAGAAAKSGTASRRRPWEMVVVVVLVLATIGMHAWSGMVIATLDSTLGQIFSGNPGAAFGGGQPVASDPKALNEPSYHWNGTQRISFLLLGIDSGPYRSEALTDTILVVSIDPVSHTAVMVSIPRDTGFLPLPDRRLFADGLYPEKINSLTTIASQNPKVWCPDLPSTADCGIRTLERSVGLYLGIDINYYATVNLQGFTDLIDALGGVKLCLPGVLADPGYKAATPQGRPGISLPAGCYVMNGEQALAYARIRKGTLTLPDGTVEQQNDFKRAARQQDVLVALRDKFATANWVFALPDLLKAVGETVQTDFPRGQAGNLASLLPLIAGNSIDKVVLDWPDYEDLPTNPLVNYLLLPKRNAIRTEAERLFGPDAAQGWYVGSTDRYPPHP